MLWRVAGLSPGSASSKITGRASRPRVERMPASVVAPLTLSEKGERMRPTTLLSSQDFPDPRVPVTQMCGRQGSRPQTGAVAIQPATYSAAVTVSASAYTGLELVLTGAALAAGQTVTIGDIQIAQETSISPFENHSMFDLELCQQFYQKHASYLVDGYNTMGANIFSSMLLPVQLKSVPAATITDLGLNTNTLVYVAAVLAADRITLRISPLATGYAYSTATIELSSEL